MVHPKHGVLELTGAPPFDEAHRGDPVATRAYRAVLASDASACCWLEGPDGQRCTDASLDATDPAHPRWTGHLAGAKVEATAVATAPERFELQWRLAGWRETRPPRVRFAGRLALPALAEITDTDPPDAVAVRQVTLAKGSTLSVTAPDMGATARLTQPAGSWVADGNGFAADFEGVATVLAISLDGPCANRRDGTWSAPPGTLVPDPITAKALAYVRCCTALRTGPDERVLLTDHRLLPLSWTRDAYYQALLLLATGTDADLDVVADHLRWLWRRCDRPDGTWARSHHADGRRKDLGFQADQQLYPVLEACDYWRVTRRLPEGLDWTDAIAGCWAAVQDQVDPATGLLASVENAADDPARAPFIGSSQVLLWYTALRLAEVAEAGDIRLDPGELRSVASRARTAFAAHFEHLGAWPYAVDGHGARIAYHDANDLPLALAPLWGFCDAGEPGWRDTVAFAWSEANNGWFSGERGGLGSIHTPGPWTLGDVQDWLVGRITDDAPRRD
ncbi:MAG TPA: glycoside hydrolase family 125 protein, partial [Candidatus Limnocylindria bacterium]|nr:glycoside hydrolase family 125 protein [Candidatus Limnocylindria bacterium]